MNCDCIHENGGECRRYPKTDVVERGRVVFKFPPADCECGERAPRTPKKAKSGKASAKEENPAAEPAVTPQKGKKGASK